MKITKSSITSIFSLFLTVTSSAQEFVAEKGSFGVDKTNGIIVWYKSNLSSQSIKSITFDDEVYTVDKATVLSYDKSIFLKADKAYKLYITKLPIVHISMDESKINSRKKISGILRYYDAEQFLETHMAVRHRGNLSLSFNKKSFDLELRKNATSSESVDAKFLHMRSDDDWILDAMFNEPLRLRSFVASNMWSKLYKPYYASLEPKAKSGFDVSYVEVFKNNTYYGIYQLMESVDRKQLQVKKNDGKTIYGRIYRAESYEGGPDFTKAPNTYENALPRWIGWENYYPYIDYTSDFGDLFQLQQLVVNGSDTDFNTKISSAFVIENAIDYFIFVNTIRATDNLGKNYSLAKYDKGEPYFLVPWDLDGTFGVIQDGKQINTTDDVLTNGLLKRLIEQNPNDYTAKLKNRWKSLRKGMLKNEKLLSDFEVLYNKFTKELVYEREFLVWQNDLNKITNIDHYKYLKDWLIKRLAYLDNYFESL